MKSMKEALLFVWVVALFTVALVTVCLFAAAAFVLEQLLNKLGIKK